ncbi:MAG TPA: nuclear transport factor 2 family protein [Thermoleophilaceae bacterium]|nr:nuclear transport factor 2 family protein [Thermoleophilaceae bacterium]
MPALASGVLRRLFELYEREGVDAALTLVAPDSVLVVPPSMSAEPDVYEGHAGARRYFAGFDGAIDDVRFLIRETHDETPDSVLAVMEVTGTGATTGIRILFEAVVECEVRDGRVVRMVAHPDLATARGEPA